MNIIIAGGRDFTNYDLLKQECQEVFQSLNVEFKQVVSGCARGVDKLGERFAEEFGYPVARFPADWSLGRGAGYIRNKEMAQNADLLIAFHDGKSKGTQHMINTMRAMNKAVFIIPYSLFDTDTYF